MYDIFKIEKDKLDRLLGNDVKTNGLRQSALRKSGIEALKKQKLFER
jgi:hypothetical protein